MARPLHFPAVSVDFPAAPSVRTGILHTALEQQGTLHESVLGTVLDELLLLNENAVQQAAGNDLLVAHHH